MAEDSNIDVNELMKKMMGNGIKEDKPQKNNKKKSADKNQNTNKGNKNMKYTGAPYNFVPFTPDVYKYPQGKQVWHDDVSSELFSGEIQYSITAQTPIIIDNGEGLFYKTSRGEYAIPGSSVRGLIRSNVQILGLSGLDDDIDDYSLMYRDITSKKEYQDILGAVQIPVDQNHKIGVLKNVKAGYLKKEGSKYSIYQTKTDKIDSKYGDMNYYVLSERRIVHEYMESKKGNRKFSYEFFIKNGKSIMQHTFNKEFDKTVKYGRVHYIGDVNKEYCPYFYEISYDLAGLTQVIAVGKPGKYSKKGYVISTGPMNEKKAVYIVPEIDEKKDTIVIPSKDIDAFKIDLQKKENILKQFTGKEFFYLPEKDGEIKPVFYFERNGRLFFGFTPHLRLFYQNTIKNGLPDVHKDSAVDYCKAIFGYSSQKESCKSKVYFTDAIAMHTTDPEELSKMILSEPKPTSYMDYLVQQDHMNPVTYNSPYMKLRGIKQYWLHQQADPTDGTDKTKVATSFYPLKAGTSFKGTIRFKNMTEDELGLLLWSIRLDPEKSMMNIGKAKPYGYGKISVNVESVKRLDKHKAYSLEQLELNPYKELDTSTIDALIQAYKDHINQYLEKHKMKKIEELGFIQDFFSIKNDTVKPAPNKIRYMNIDKGDYKNRKTPLPTIKEIISSAEEEQERRV